MFIRII